MKQNQIKLKRILILIMYTAVLITVDYALSSLPNIQVIMLLVVTLSLNTKIHEGILVITVYSIIDTLIGGGFGVYTIAMIIGWFGVLMMTKLAKKINNVMGFGQHRYYAIVSLVLSLWYNIPYAVISAVIYKIDFMNYITADIPFAFTLALSSYFSIDILFNRLNGFIERELNGGK